MGGLGSRPQRLGARRWLWLDVVALLAWSSLLLKYFVSGQLSLLIHPNYFGLVLATSLFLFLLASLRAWQLRQPQLLAEGWTHATLFSAGWSRGLLIATAMLGFLISPQVLASETALQRGVAESLPLTRQQPQAFRAASDPEKRSLIEWIRTLDVYPEPDAYTGQPARLQGFVIHLPELPDNYLLISRFIITCCAVDAYPVGLPVKLAESRQAYPPDTWVEVGGEMIAEVLPGTPSGTAPAAPKRRLVLQAQSIEKISVPRDPYEY